MTSSTASHSQVRCIVLQTYLIKTIQPWPGPDSDSLIQASKASTFCVEGLGPTHSHRFVSAETAGSLWYKLLRLVLRGRTPGRAQGGRQIIAHYRKPSPSSSCFRTYVGTRFRCSVFSSIVLLASGVKLLHARNREAASLLFPPPEEEGSYSSIDRFPISDISSHRVIR